MMDPENVSDKEADTFELSAYSRSSSIEQDELWVLETESQ
jgi:hypothetical protein